MDFDDAIRYLMRLLPPEKNREALWSLFGVLRGLDTGELRRERQRDLHVESQKFGV